MPYVQQPAWGRSREFEITTRSVGRNGMTQSTTGDLEDEEAEEENEDVLVHGRKKRKVAFMPSLGKVSVLSYIKMWT
jgi:mitochondrial chaperone BCS1